MHPAQPYGNPRRRPPGRLYAASAPDYAVPPGEVLDEFLSDSGMSRRQMAVRLQLSERDLDRVIEGEARITAKLARRLEAGTGIPARVWTNLEADYRATQARLARRTRWRLRLTAVLSSLILFSAALSWSVERWFGYTGVLVVTGVVLTAGTALGVYNMRFLARDAAEERHRLSVYRAALSGVSASQDERRE